jgi:hypothetical protein
LVAFLVEKYFKKVLLPVTIVRNFVIAFRRPHSYSRAFPKAGCSEAGYDVHIEEYRPMKKKEISSLNSK